MYVVLIDLRKSNLPILATNSSKLSLKQSVFLTDVSNYCEPQKIKLFIYIYLKISRNIGSNFMDFWQFLVSFWHFGEQISSILRAQSGQAYPRG